MTAEAALVIRDVAVVVGSIAALCTALVVIARSPIIGRPIAWAWHRLVVDPLALWFGRIVRDEARVVTSPIALQLDRLTQDAEDLRAQIQREHDRTTRLEGCIARIAGIDPNKEKKAS